MDYEEKEEKKNNPIAKWRNELRVWMELLRVEKQLANKLDPESKEKSLEGE